MHADFRHRPAPGPKQTGSATLVMSLVLLVLMTMVAVYTGRTVLLEEKIAGNDFRARQAFEAAESGLSTAVAYMASGYDKDNDGNADPVIDTDDDGIGDVNALTFSDNSSVTVTVTGAFPAFALQSVGVSDDLTATRTVRTRMSTVDVLPNAPDNPLTARGSVAIDGSATIHNPEGHSTIWSGGDVDLGANNSTATEVADPTDSNYPTCMDTPMTCSLTPSSSKIAVGLDVVEHDASLANLTAEQMFYNFFGTTMDIFRDSRVTREVAPADANNLASASTPGINLGVGEVIWVEGDTVLSNSVTVGCSVALSGSATCPSASVNPTVLIINGDLTTSGTPNFYGLVYVTGHMEMSSNTTVTGALIVAGDTVNHGGGSLDAWYNSAVLNQVRDNGPLAGAPGSWQDW
ncbi:MAG TPA: pilus assembly PilX N-terminal domain-containing protein [Woeseiaceae bacterium]